MVLIWQEDHPVMTNAIGLFQMNIGNTEAINTLGSVASFADIPWGEGNFQLQVWVDAGDGFNDPGTSEFQSVPFALYAARSAGGTGEPGSDNQVLSLTGNTLSISGGNSVNLSSVISSDSNWSQEQDSISTFSHVGIGTSNPNQSTLAVQGLNDASEAPLFEVMREDGYKQGHHPFQYIGQGSGLCHR